MAPAMLRALRRLLARFGFDLGYRSRRPYDPPPRRDADPYAWRTVAPKPKPRPRSGAIAVAEPDE
jgi:hypothetical protein